MAGDPYDLARFVAAQDFVFERVRAELRRGRKESHWMWFVFPQIAGLGTSPRAQRYALASLAQARAYLDHPVLGARLRECATLVNAVQGHAIEEIFGSLDALKFHSSMTLFAKAAGGDTVFAEALGKYFGGALDTATLQRLGERA